MKHEVRHERPRGAWPGRWYEWTDWKKMNRFLAAQYGNHRAEMIAEGRDARTNEDLRAWARTKP